MASSAAMSQIQVFSRGGLLVEIGFEQPIPVIMPAKQTANVQRHMNRSAVCLCHGIFFENNISLHFLVAGDFRDEGYYPSILCEVNLNSILAVATRSSKGKTE
jgi:hypothetical protein